MLHDPPPPPPSFSVRPCPFIDTPCRNNLQIEGLRSLIDLDPVATSLVVKPSKLGKGAGILFQKDFGGDRDAFLAAATDAIPLFVLQFFFFFFFFFFANVAPGRVKKK